MSQNKRYVIVQNKNKKEISYFEYNIEDGYKFHPKNKLNIKDLINVDEMVVINPNFITKLINKKCNKEMTKILKVIKIIYETDSDDDSVFEMALDEMELFRRCIIDRYQKYMDQKEADLLLKKLEILEEELNLKRIAYFEKNNDLFEEKGKGR